MPNEQQQRLFTLTDHPTAHYLIAGWRRQWSNGGRISSGLPRYLIEKNDARQIGQLTDYVNRMCYPFQVAGTHDAFRPAAAFHEGLPSAAMSRQNAFYEIGNGLIVFLGEEPWFRLDIYAAAFFAAIAALGIRQTVAVEGVNGPAPPDLERRITCVYSRPEMRDTLERYGVQFSSYGSRGRQGPTIGMALVSIAHYEHPDVQMFRMGAMAPMYPFMTSNNNQVGITRITVPITTSCAACAPCSKLIWTCRSWNSWAAGNRKTCWTTWNAWAVPTAKRARLSTRCGWTTSTRPSWSRWTWIRPWTRRWKTSCATSANRPRATPSPAPAIPVGTGTGLPSSRPRH